MTTDLLIPDEVVRRYAFKTKKKLQEARALFARLDQFLDVAYTDVCQPDRELDEAWHEFILHTRDYINYCERRFGRVIHHVPTSPVSCESEAADEGSMYVNIEPTADLASATKCKSCSSDCRRCGKD